MIINQTFNERALYGSEYFMMRSDGLTFGNVQMKG